MARSEPLLRAEGVTKEFFGVTALSNVDFELAAGEIHALVGENGAGKSTLIKILTGAYRRDRGKITLEGEPVDPADVKDAQKLGIGTVYQEVNLLPNLTVAENLFLGREPKRFGLTSHREANRRSREILSQYGLDIDVTAVLATYSVAVRQIVAIARAVDLSGKVLILDEPTASLDAAEVTRLFAILEGLKARGLGIVFITHFFDQVYRIADRVTILRNGQKVATRPIEGLERLELVSMMLGRELKEQEAHAAEPVDYSRKPVIASFQGIGKRGRIAPFDLTMHAGEVVGVAGLLGSGRTETAELMFGIAQPDEGRISVDGSPVSFSSPREAIRHGFGFCPEDRKLDGIVEDLSVRENVILALQARRGWAKPLSRKEQEEIADRYIAALDIRTSDREKPIKFLSGGNQQKVILARWLATDPRLLILDEPTRGIDVGAHAEIIRLIGELRERGMSLLVISSELEELVAYATRVRVLADRRHTGELEAGAITPDTIMRAIAAGEDETPGDRGGQGRATEIMAEGAA
ncbi:sugar ABC transporter ATP-binding protein [Jiella pacifica]|uniref:ATP-binding cassette domain-containing protein n=1 Tax=Jiella pacifica TaxID=2696469 RepID=A0A6N9T0Z1_9HYPH|nr:sugar ABC transporter ATP-binding protein [Jiella pacifica]NDW03865.1 ATP-binding cassette domain-containing protein [Jiella pacifica]